MNCPCFIPVLNTSNFLYLCFASYTEAVYQLDKFSKAQHFVQLMSMTRTTNQTLHNLFLKNGLHKAVSQINSVGLPSNIFVQVLAPFSTNIFTSLSCLPLSCSTYLKIQCTHIIFSFSSFSINFQNVSTIDAHPFTMATLPPDAINILKSIQGLLPGLIKAVANLKKLCSTSRKRSLGKTPTILPSATVSTVAEDSDEDSDSDASNGPD